MGGAAGVGGIGGGGGGDGSSRIHHLISRRGWNPHLIPVLDKQNDALSGGVPLGDPLTGVLGREFLGCESVMTTRKLVRFHPPDLCLVLRDWYSTFEPIHSDAVNDLTNIFL